LVSVKRHFTILFLITLLVCLAACHTDLPPVTTQPTIPQHTVTFMVGGTVYDTQLVEENAVPQQVIPTGDDYTFRYWVNENGETVQPELLNVTADVTYTAVSYPRLSKHAVFLFPDQENMLHPESNLTPAALRNALNALADEGAIAHFPNLPGGGSGITTEVLRDVMLSFYEEAAVDAVFDPMESRVLSRSDLATILCALQNRRVDEFQTIEAGQVLPADLLAYTPNLLTLLEASIPHTPALDGSSWAQLDLPTGWDPGFRLQDGWLYYVKEDGCLLRSDTLGRLTFDADGRYTSGDPELDTIVADIIKQFVIDNPEMERIDLLYEAHVYCRDSFKYLRRNSYGFGATGWEIDDAKVMFTKGRGNCYNYAAAFWALARGLGYEARAVAGTCTGSDQPHGWVFIEFDGKDYIFDCEWEMAYRTERQIYDKNMFMIPSNKWSYWSYKWVK
jgi:hypothetical protein